MKGVKYRLSFLEHIQLSDTNMYKCLNLQNIINRKYA